MKSITLTTKHLLLACSLFLIAGAISCKKLSTAENTNSNAEFGCDAKTTLVNLNSVQGTLAYNSAQGEWQVVIMNPQSLRAYSCSFCDKSIYNAIVAGQPQSAQINVTVTGNVKRRYANQEPINVSSGGYEWYVLTATAIQ